jgi:hypothetical protein
MLEGVWSSGKATRPEKARLEWMTTVEVMVA